MEDRSTSVRDLFGKKFTYAPEKTLMLDYDGTLAPFREERDKAVPYKGVREVLDSIQVNTGTRIIIVSGRKVDDLLPLLGLSRKPEIWGSHGFEHLLPDGNIEKLQLPANCVSKLELAYSWIIEQNYEGYCEKKPASIAFHFRGLNQERRDALSNEVHRAWGSLTGKGGLSIQPFDQGVELRFSGVHKGQVVRQIISESDKSTFIAYLGDDLTDEDAFKALRERGVSILVRGEYRKTYADVWLKPPHQLIEFLNTWYRCCN